MSNIRCKHLDQWYAQFVEFKTSGLTTVEWCSRHNINIHTFYKRNRVLRKNGILLSESSENNVCQDERRESATMEVASTCHSALVPSQELVPLIIRDDPQPQLREEPLNSNSASSDSEPGISLILDGMRVQISNHADLKLVDSVIRALRTSC